MAYICNKKIKCKECRHYKFDEDYNEMACFAEQDEKELEERWSWLTADIEDERVKEKTNQTLENSYRKMVETMRVPEDWLDKNILEENWLDNNITKTSDLKKYTPEYILKKAVEGFK